jgi:UDP-N-acetylmuramoyl-tripeptide--D-alanyl-D-alanine ligase
MNAFPTTSLSHILTTTNGTCAATSGEVQGVSIDTRTLIHGNLYVAIKGDRLDGHAFVGDALAKGAPYALVETLIDRLPLERQIVVSDTLLALQALARHARMQAAYRVVGITGSVGKTSTKEMMALALGSQYRTHATQGNYNNHLGLPLTILNTPVNTEYLVLEMGMNHGGEIALLCEIGKPDAGIITTVEAVHLEFFDSVAGIARAKAELVEGMTAGAPIILPRDNPHYALLEEIATAHGQQIVSFGTHEQADYRLCSVAVTPEGTHAEMIAFDTLMQFDLRALGAHHAMNALSVLACCDTLGVDLAKAATALRQYREPKGRGTLTTLPWGAGEITVIDETYNASPAAMNAAFARVAAIRGGRRVIVVLGDMLELGEDAPALHASLAGSLTEHSITHVHTVGELMFHLHASLGETIIKHHGDSNAAISETLLEVIEAGDIVLVKGSRGSRMEAIITALTTESAYAAAPMKKLVHDTIG